MLKGLPSTFNKDMQVRLLAFPFTRSADSPSSPSSILCLVPVTKSKSLQEDKEGMFDSFDTIKNMILIAEGVLSTLTVRQTRQPQTAESYAHRSTQTCVRLP